MLPPYRYFSDETIDSTALLQHLQHLPWQQEQLFLFGRWVAVPRRVLFFADIGVTYRYSGVDHIGRGWPDSLKPLKQKAEYYAQQTFNSVLLNRYQTGDDYMGWHSDDEVCLGPAPTIAMLSLGCARDFLFRVKTAPKKHHSLQVTDSSWLIMLPPTQALWQHSLPKRKKANGIRVSLTFRQVLPSA
jgi:alkylated DNA repair dioxygenase AlkB